MQYAAYVFDAYGTLFDVNAAIMRHAGSIGPDAPAMAALWRVKQLEYSWTRTLMGRYADFWQLTEQALDFVLARHAAAQPLRQQLLDAYWQLDAYADAAPLLRSLKAAGHRAVIFTNGTVAMAEALAMRCAVVSGTMPTPTLHSTSRQMASKLRSCTRRRNGRPIRLALSARKRCRALARSRPTMS